MQLLRFSTATGAPLSHPPSSSSSSSYAPPSPSPSVPQAAAGTSLHARLSLPDDLFTTHIRNMNEMELLLRIASHGAHLDAFLGRLVPELERGERIRATLLALGFYVRPVMTDASSHSEFRHLQTLEACRIRTSSTTSSAPSRLGPSILPTLIRATQQHLRSVSLLLRGITVALGKLRKDAETVEHFSSLNQSMAEELSFRGCHDMAADKRLVAEKELGLYKAINEILQGTSLPIDVSELLASPPRDVLSTSSPPASASSPPSMSSSPIPGSQARHVQTQPQGEPDHVVEPMDIDETDENEVEQEGAPGKRRQPPTSATSPGVTKRARRAQVTTMDVDEVEPQSSQSSSGSIELTVG